AHPARRIRLRGTHADGRGSDRPHRRRLRPFLPPRRTRPRGSRSRTCRHPRGPLPWPRPMTTLVLPDVHNHFAEAEAQIARHPADRIVFLGDYFDSFDDTPAMAAATAEWLKDSLAKPDRLHLWGNHDLWHRFPRNPQIC